MLPLDAKLCTDADVGFFIAALHGITNFADKGAGRPLSGRDISALCRMLRMMLAKAACAYGSRAAVLYIFFHRKYRGSGRGQHHRCCHQQTKESFFSFVSLLGFVLQLFLGISPKRQKAHPISLTGNEIRLGFFLFDFWVAKRRRLALLHCEVFFHFCQPLMVKNCRFIAPFFVYFDL